MCFGSQSPDHRVFLKVTFVCNGRYHFPRRQPIMRTQFAIGLIQQLPHLSNLLLCLGMTSAFIRAPLVQSARPCGLNTALCAAIPGSKRNPCEQGVKLVGVLDLMG